MFPYIEPPSGYNRGRSMGATTPSAAAERLRALSSGFRRRYLRHGEIEAQLRAWATEFPDLVRLTSIGKSREGRDLWLATLGPRPEEARPSVWVDGNMHAGELSGSSVALAIAEDVLALHLGATPEHGEHALPPHVHDVLRQARVFVLPRMSPDGAEHVLVDGRYVRSVPRDERHGRAHARWINEDVDGDGLALLCRREHPSGDFVSHPDAADVLVPRTLDDPPPYYQLFPEGRIEHFDGDTIPTPAYLADNFPDLNRNFPFRWAPDPQQLGAGDFAGSEPEARAVIEHAVRHPSIYVWLNLHTFGGCHIRPPGDVPDAQMDPYDLALYRQLGADAQAITGYPMVSGFEEFLYEPGKPLFGALSEWAYEHRGALAWVTELWDLFARLGMARPKKFVDVYTAMTRADLLALHRWDGAENEGRIFRPWKRVTHPQLGEVEVGGVDRRVGLYNPSYRELPAVCSKMSAFFLRVAAMVPQLRARASVEPLTAGASRVTFTIENHGYLPTTGVKKSKGLPWNEPLYLDVTCEGPTLAEHTAAHRELGHLEGWGRGLGDPGQAVFYPRTPGSASSQTVRVVVHGKGRVHLCASSPRTGAVSTTVEIG